MVVRIKFSAEIYVGGDNMAEIKEKFEEVPLFSIDAIDKYGADFSEVMLVEDADTFKDLKNEFDEC